MKDTFDVLKALVAKVKCKPAWQFATMTADGSLVLIITVTGIDAADPERMISINHSFPVPTATYNEPTWRRWLFEQCRRVENHELGEWFRVDGERPFAPLHGPGEDPYSVHEFRPDVDRRTRQDGFVRES